MTEKKECQVKGLNLCPLMENPKGTACPFLKEIVSLQTDVKWLKRLMVPTFLGIISLALEILLVSVY